MEIYLRLECLGGNIGGFYHFGLGDGSGTPSLGINLIDKLDLRKPLERNTNRLSFLSQLTYTFKRNQRKKNTKKLKGKLAGNSGICIEELKV